jgi:hypothetical protein
MLKVTMMLGSFDRLLGESNMAQAIDVARMAPAPAGLSQRSYLDNAVRGKRGRGDFSYEIFAR